MQSSLNFNITKTIFHTPPIHEIYGNVTPCYVSCSPIIHRINAELTTITPHSHPLINAFHNRVSAVITVLYTSRPRALRLARSVSSRAFCVVASGSARCFYPCLTQRCVVGLGDFDFHVYGGRAERFGNALP